MKQVKKVKKWRRIISEKSEENKNEKIQWMNESVDELINDGGDCRTAPATPGLLKKNLLVFSTHGIQQSLSFTSNP